MFVKFIASLALLFIVSCSNLLYFPSRLKFDHPKRHNLVVENLTIRTSDNVALHAWLISSPLVKIKKGLILQYHGNAENLTTHYLSLAWLANAGYDLLIFDYRGYGQSEGNANPKGLYFDSQAALDFAEDLKNKKNYKKFITVGQSLGGSVLLKTLSESKNSHRKIDLVILESTFRSNSATAAAILRKSWVTFLFSPLSYVLMQDTYNATEADLKNWSYPTLCVTHKDDPVIASYLTVNLCQSLTATKKKWMWLRDDEYAGHITSFFTPDGPLNQRLLNHLETEI